MKAIIAVNNLCYIGLNNGLPWHSKEDFKHFKFLTTAEDIEQVLLVGYNTAKDLPNLKNRKLIVALGENHTEILKLIHKGEIDWCIGGKKTYERFAQYFTELHISYINDNSIGDTMFPNLSNLNPKCKIFKYFF